MIIKRRIMEPLLLKFKEKPSEKSLDYSILEYSKELNLSVLKASNQPAVKYFTLGTETFTKTTGEGADSDLSNANGRVKSLLDTSTETLAGGEPSDSDYSNSAKLKALLDTTTITESVEDTDRD